MNKKLKEVQMQTIQWLKQGDKRGEMMLDFIEFLWWRKHIRPMLEYFGLRHRFFKT